MPTRWANTPPRIDVGDQDHRAVDGFRIAHVGDVVCAQVDFRRTAGAFDDDGAVMRAQTVMRGQHRVHRDTLVVVVGRRLQVADSAAMDDHLCPRVAVGLEQDRIEIGMWCDPGSLRLQRLGAADLAAVNGHGGVQCHVLRLERRDGDGRAGAASGTVR